MAAIAAADYRSELKASPGKVRFLDIPARRYLLIDGNAKPGDREFREAIGALYPVAYTLHFALRRRGVETPVGALQGLYWSHGPAAGTWRLLLPVPPEATAQEVEAALAEVREKKAPVLIDRVRCEEWEEGSVAQIMHVGPYDAETPTVGRLRGALAEHGLRARGPHHEIYISDPNRTPPERLKTLLSQAVV